MTYSLEYLIGSGFKGFVYNSKLYFIINGAIIDAVSGTKYTDKERMFQVDYFCDITINIERV